MSLFRPLAESLEHFVYDRVCGLAILAPPDRGGATHSDSLASPFGSATDGAPLARP